MFKTIIWATDGSEAAERALPLALDLTAQVNGMLLVVHADERLGGRASGVPVIADEEDVEAELAAKVKELVESGVNASFRVVRGTGRDPADLIADVAKASLLLRQKDRAAIIIDMQATTLNVLNVDGADDAATGTDSGVISVEHDKQLYREYVRYLMSQSDQRSPAWLEVLPRSTPG